MLHVVYFVVFFSGLDTKGRLHQEGLNKSQFRVNQGFVELGFNLNRAVLHHLILSIA